MRKFCKFKHRGKKKNKLRVYNGWGISWLVNCNVYKSLTLDPSRLFPGGRLFSPYETEKAEEY